MLEFIFIKGFVVGLLMCAPVGPIGLLCVRRSIAYGRASGFASVLGAAVVDGLYCLIAGLGITVIANFLRDEEVWIRLVGGWLLIAVGVKIFLSPPREAAGPNNGAGLLKAFSSAFVVMLANPMPILVFTAAFTALGIHGWRGDSLSTIALVSGVFCGSAVWAPILVTVINLIRPRFDTEHLRMLNRIAGSVIAALGLTLNVWALV
jgi:threonine/homoserine/homoserine lactone efflux protein